MKYFLGGIVCVISLTVIALVIRHESHEMQKVVS
jgi:hypothetical protein